MDRREFIGSLIAFTASTEKLTTSEQKIEYPPLEIPPNANKYTGYKRIMDAVRQDVGLSKNLPPERAAWRVEG